MAKCWFLHGDNYPQSRGRLDALTKELKNRGSKELIRLNGEKVKLEEIKQVLEAKSLFGGERLVIIENLLSAVVGRRKKEIIDYLLKEPYDSSCVLWEKKEIKGAILNKFRSKFKVEIFKIPAIIFKFLDELRPGNPQEIVGLLHQMNEKEPEMIFYMLIQRVRQLILVKDLGKEGLEGLQGWQQARLLNQARKFELKQLLSFYHQLLESDYQQKTSQTPFSLFSTLDLLLINL